MSKVSSTTKAKADSSSCSTLLPHPTNANVAYIHLRTTNLQKQIQGDEHLPAIVEHETFGSVTESELAMIRKYLPSGKRKDVFVDAYWAECVTVELAKVVTSPTEMTLLEAFLGKRKVVGRDLIECIEDASN